VRLQRRHRQKRAAAFPGVPRRPRVPGVRSRLTERRLLRALITSGFDDVRRVQANRRRSRARVTRYHVDAARRAQSVCGLEELERDVSCAVFQALQKPCPAAAASRLPSGVGARGEEIKRGVFPPPPSWSLETRALFFTSIVAAEERRSAAGT